MKSITLEVRTRGSECSKLGNLIVTLRELNYASPSEVIIGRPGSPNVVRKMDVGDAVLYETPDEGIMEVRLMGIGVGVATFLITQVAPRLGLAAGLMEEDPRNLPFEESELRRISTGMSELKDKLAESEAFNAEQLDFIGRNLDELKSKADKLGRKD